MEIHGRRVRGLIRRQREVVSARQARDADGQQEFLNNERRVTSDELVVPRSSFPFVARHSSFVAYMPFWLDGGTMPLRRM